MNDNEDIPLESSITTCTTVMPTSNNVHNSSNTQHQNTSISKNKRFRKSNGELSSNASFHKTGNTINASNTSDDEHSDDDEHLTCINQSSSDQAPSFNGRVVINDKKSNRNSYTTSSSSEIQQLLSLTKKFETQYLKPMIVRLERLETMTQNSFSNQKKIQNVLRKQKVTHRLLIVIRTFTYCFR